MSTSPIRRICEKKLGTSIKEGDKLEYKNNALGSFSSSVPKNIMYHPVIYIGDDEVVHATNNGHHKEMLVKRNTLILEGL